MAAFSWKKHARPRARLSRPGNRHRSHFVIGGCTAAERAAAERVSTAFGGAGECNGSSTRHERGRWVQYIVAAVSRRQAGYGVTFRVRRGYRTDVRPVAARPVPYRQ